MCIALLSTAHPKYSLILIDNRDEFLNRPTDPASWWPDNPNVLGGRDLLRSTHGTWMGITKSGKIAVLTNFREGMPVPSAISRGAIIRKWLTEDVGSTDDFVRNVISTGIARDAGGFSLVCGRVGERLAVVSNRAEDQSQVPRICGDVVQTVGLSNAAFTDRSWKKVLDGEELMLDAIRAGIREACSEDELIEKFLGVLSIDTLKRVEPENEDEGGLATYINELRNTIFIPALGRKESSRSRGDEFAAANKTEEAEVLDGNFGDHKQLGVSGLYGTQKQTVVLVDHDMNARYFERTLFDQVPNRVPIGSGDVDVKFRIEA